MNEWWQFLLWVMVAICAGMIGGAVVLWVIWQAMADAVARVMWGRK